MDAIYCDFERILDVKDTLWPLDLPIATIIQHFNTLLDYVTKEQRTERKGSPLVWGKFKHKTGATGQTEANKIRSQNGGVVLIVHN
jgi:hypothetical protein